MTTEVSSRPRVGFCASATERRIHHGVEVGAEAGAVDSRRAAGGVGEKLPGREATRGDGPELGDRHAVAGHHDRLTRLDLPQNRSGVVA